MEVNFKRGWISRFLAVTAMVPVLFLLSAAIGNSVIKSTEDQSKDSSLKAPTVREVLTAQKLFVVKVSDVKMTQKGDSVNFRAELRDAFKIICYDGDRTITELDWTRCIGRSCPEAGLYAAGTAAYKKLDVLIERAAKNEDHGYSLASLRSALFCSLPHKAASTELFCLHCIDHFTCYSQRLFLKLTD